MATAAREEKQKQSHEGLGAGGKFRKTPFRRTTQATPYDRPPTILRNPGAATDGWISKLVDPAQRLITSSAHRLFSSVFRKRLPPPQSLSTGLNHEANIKDKEEVTMDSPGLQKCAIDQSAGPSNASDGQFTELEQILEHKTFTRSEIDRLTALLHSRTADIPSENQEKRSEVTPSKTVVLHDRKEEFPITPAQGINGTASHLASDHVFRRSVLDEDVASPAELAKAYMGSRPSKVSPSMLGLRSQAVREDSPILSSLPFPSKSPMMSLVPRTSSNGGPPENGFLTPRSRGRSAIYSMARTPYSRVRPNSTLKGAGSNVDAYGGASSSQSVWEPSQPSGSIQGAVKRRFSVLDNDIGSVGPVRRIRHKPTLLSSRGLSSPVSGTSILGARISSEAAQNPSSSIQKPLSFGEPKRIFTKAFSENGGNAVPSTSFSTVPSKSSEMASKILEQLDKLVSPKEKSSEPKLLTVRDKSPAKLSPSMLRGQALKSLEDVDSSKFMDNADNNNSNSKLDVSLDHLIPDARDFISSKQDKVKENGPLRIVDPLESSTMLINGSGCTTEKKDIVPNVKTAVSAATNSVAHPPQKKRAFKMSAHEDFLDLDDDDHPNGVASNSFADGRGKVDTSLNEGKNVATSNFTQEKPSALSVVKPPASSPMKENTDLQTSDRFVLSETSTNFISSSAPSSSMTVLPTVGPIQSSFIYEKVALPKDLHAVPPVFNFGGKVTSMKDSDAASPVFNFGSKRVPEVAKPQFTFASSAAVGESVDVKFGASPHSKPENSSRVSAVEAGAENSVPKPLDSDKVDNKNNSNVGVSFGIPETAVSSAVSSSSTTMFSLGTSPNNSNPNNGPSTTLFSSSAPSVFNNLTSPNSSGSMTHTTHLNSVNNIATNTAVMANSNTISSSAPAPSPSFSSEPSLKFESSITSTAVTPVPVNSSLDSEGKNKEDRGFGSLSSTSFPGTSATIANTGSNMFVAGGSGGGTATTSAGNQSQGSPFGAGSGSVPISQALSAWTGDKSFGQIAPIEPGSSATSPSFGLAGNTASGSSVFDSPFTAKLFSSGASAATGSSTSSLEGNSISSSTAPSLFGSSWPGSKSPVFASTFNSTSSSTGFSYGASSAAPATTNVAPFLFGGSSTAATTTSSAPATNNAPFVFGGSSTTAATNNSAPIAFGASTASTSTNSTSMLFGSSNGASSNSIFSFTSSATTSAPAQVAFGNPNTAFPFGSSGNNDQMNMEDSMAEDNIQAPTPTVQSFGQQPVSTPQSAFAFASTPIGAIPFQFASQQNLANPQNPPPFQASGSLGTQGGSFSLGSSDKSNRRILKVSGKHRNRKK